MIRRFRHLRQALRLLPAMAWLAMQLSMVAIPVAAPAHPVPQNTTLAALLEIVSTEDVTLCTPAGTQTLAEHQEHSEHSDCPWCRAFSAATLPEGVCDPQPVWQHADAGWHVGARPSTTVTPRRLSNLCRAPPTSI